MKEMRTYLFILALSFCSAAILSITASALRKPQQLAKEKYQYSELFKAAGLDNLISSGSIIELARKHLKPMLTDTKGNIFTFEQKGVDYTQYLQKGRKSGYSNFPLKIFYQLEDGGVVIPIKGYGLWEAIYGYIGIASDGFTILGLTFFDQKETPGLGAVIQTPAWQKQFNSKVLFHGKDKKSFGIDFTSSEMQGLLTAAQKTYTVDAISGATITTHGVKKGIKNSLSPYIPLFRNMQQKK